MQKLKKRWGIHTNTQLVIIFVVFAVTGSSAAKLATPLTEFFGITKDSSSAFVYWFARIFLIFPIYQVLLVFFGFIFGQFSFFWNFEKKMLSRMGLGFLFKSKNES
ncbi:MAG: diacylglyceryl transferase [Flavobacteriaceae bacterium]|nr:diacylglyceryl transferase [Flavobacteriaceae bacterium]